MSDKPYNEPAFPVQDCAAYQYGGMSLRDWFAGQALTGMQIKDDGDYSSLDHVEGHPTKRALWAARAAYRIADAMLVWRSKP